MFRTYFKHINVFKSSVNICLRKFSNDIYEVRIPFNNRSDIIISTSKYAGFADGAAVVRQGDTSVLVTVVGRQKTGTSSFVPLTVDYRQKAAAAGRIPTSHHRRETLPTEQEILVSRMIDRSIRPLFLPALNNHEVQIICNVLAVDGIHDPEILCVNAASTALALSHIPWNGPVGSLRLGFLDDEVIISPTKRDLIESKLNMIVTAAPQNLVVMLEASADNILQQDFLKSIKKGVKECQKVISAIQEIVKARGKPKAESQSPETNQELINKISSLSRDKLQDIFTNYSHDKISRDEAIKELRANVLEDIKLNTPDLYDSAGDVFSDYTKHILRELVLENELRCDGRKATELRPISAEVDLYFPLHGSALYQRGQTQVLCTVSLDSLSSAIQMDPIQMLTSGLKEKNFFVHYEFPPYAVKEIGRVGPAVRREIGHGALAEKGLKPVVPKDFPFTIRLTSEVLQSNGSSSMATVCAGSMALMDAGVPISNPAAGVAIGLVTKYNDNDTKHLKKYKLLTDILGIEDYMGDMDFKIAGTKKGINALQADIKIPGLPLKVVMEAVQAGCEAKSAIIDIMNNTIREPRKDKKSSWPVTETIDIPASKRGKFIGLGGINLKKLFVSTGVQINFDDESGLYHMFAPNQFAMKEAKEYISQILASEREPTLEFGAIYTAKIVEIRESGLMVTLYPGMNPTLLHLSQLDHRKVSDARVLDFKEGQEIQVKYFGKDPVSGQMRLSRKVLLPPSSTVKNLQKE
ncbi:hypothetical protein O3M35_004090 [Rhynocoris fuscipes]|uniref:polyribonucleotide nucleotidyltransferase n=1 Tax=Rhynocoris fuscipes TaxID=488301 RepID=A0AAW1CJG1_9HEMI